MRLFSYTCPSCDEYFKEIQAVQYDDYISIRCSECGSVEEIFRINDADGPEGYATPVAGGC